MKIISLLTDGKVYGGGRYARQAHRSLKRYALGGMAAAGAAALVLRHGRGEQDERDDEQDDRIAALYESLGHVHAPLDAPDATTFATEPLYERAATARVPSEFVPDPVPPPPGTLGDVPEVYERDIDGLKAHYEAIMTAQERAARKAEK
jgi:hypothetical protein